MSLSAAVSEGLREALIWQPTITEKLGTYGGEPSIHTRRPVPTGVTGPSIVIGPNIIRTDQDFLTSRLPVLARDIVVYGQSGSPGSANDQYRDVEAIADSVYDLFHRNRDSLVVDGFHVVDIVASGPIPAPTDNERLIGRAVMLTIRLHRSA